MNKNTKEITADAKPTLSPEEMVTFDINKIKEFNDNCVGKMKK